MKKFFLNLIKNRTRKETLDLTDPMNVLRLRQISDFHRSAVVTVREMQKDVKTGDMNPVQRMVYNQYLVALNTKIKLIESALDEESLSDSELKNLIKPHKIKITTT